MKTFTGSAWCPVSQFLLEVISNLVQKTCCPLRYLQSPALLKNLVCGHNEVSVRKWKSFFFPVGIKHSLCSNCAAITLSQGVQKHIERLLNAMFFTSLPIVMYFLTHPGSGQVNRPQSLLVPRFLGWPFELHYKAVLQQINSGMEV